MKVTVEEILMSLNTYDGPEHVGIYYVDKDGDYATSLPVTEITELLISMNEQIINLNGEISRLSHLTGAMRERAWKAEEEFKQFKEIQNSVTEFFDKLEKLSIAKGKDKPTLEELLEYIEHAKAEAIKELLDKIEKQAIPNEDDVYWVELDDIYNSVKEMVGEKR